MYSRNTSVHVRSNREACFSPVNVSKQLNVVEKWHQVEVDDIMTGNETNSGSVGGKTGQNKHKQNVRGKKDI